MVLYACETEYTATIASSAAAGFQQFCGRHSFLGLRKSPAVLCLVTAALPRLRRYCNSTVASLYHASCQLCICACKILPTFLHTSDAIKLIWWCMLYLLLFFTVRRCTCIWVYQVPYRTWNLLWEHCR